jgi:hypothetical protein
MTTPHCFEMQRNIGVLQSHDHVLRDIGVLQSHDHVLRDIGVLQSHDHVLRDIGVLQSHDHVLRDSVPLDAAALMLWPRCLPNGHRWQPTFLFRSQCRAAFIALSSVQRDALFSTSVMPSLPSSVTPSFPPA